MLRVTRARLGPGGAPALFAAFIVAADDVGYLYAIATQGSGAGGRVAYVATLLAATSACAVVGSRPRRDVRVRAFLLGLATGATIALGFLGIFSIGFPLLVAGGFLAYALGASAASGHALALAGVVAGLALAAGLLLIP